MKTLRFLLVILVFLPGVIYSQGISKKEFYEVFYPASLVYDKKDDVFKGGILEGDKF